MKFSHLIIMLKLITSIFAAPIGEEGRQALKNILKSIEKEISESAKWKFENCNEYTEFPDATKPKEMIENLLEKVKNFKEKLRKIDVDPVLEMVMKYSEKMEQNLSKIVKCLPSYNCEWRFGEAVRIEKGGKSRMKLGNINEIKSAQKYLSGSTFENIYHKLEMVNILLKMTSLEKQEKYAKHFLMYYFTKEDLEKDLANAEKYLDETPAYCASTDKMIDAMNKLGSYDIEHPCCCPCIWSGVCCMSALFAFTIPVDLTCCIRRRRAEHKVEKNRQKLAKFDKERVESEKKIAAEH